MDSPSATSLRRSPATAAALSFLTPGLGQLYNGEWAKGLAVLCVALGTGGALAFSVLGPPAARSWVSTLLLGVVVLCVWIPAVMDAWQRAAGKAAPLLSGAKAWYVVVMLLAVGPMALPLLWQSRAVSRGAKIAWTVAVLVIALLAILVVLLIGPLLETLLTDSGALLGMR
jgi:hypothetical protein